MPCSSGAGGGSSRGSSSQRPTPTPSPYGTPPAETAPRPLARSADPCAADTGAADTGSALLATSPASLLAEPADSRKHSKRALAPRSPRPTATSPSVSVPGMRARPAGLAAFDEPSPSSLFKSDLPRKMQPAQPQLQPQQPGKPQAGLLRGVLPADIANVSPAVSSSGGAGGFDTGARPARPKWQRASPGQIRARVN
ncbi:hypothetical protein T492DRAFT_831991 [Pavlovales sp. CCMP2436]|nr:hypothetical protein T492DRAFT_831991 [Pavlovales sp. CCMP2436]